MNFEFEYPTISKQLSVQKTLDNKVTVFVEATKKSYVIGELQYKLLLEMDGSKDVKKLSKLSKTYNEQQMIDLIKLFQKIGFISNVTENIKRKWIVREGFFRLKLRLLSGNKLFRSDSWFVKIVAFIILYLSLPVFVGGLIKFYYASEHFSGLSLNVYTSVPLYIYLLLFFIIIAVHEMGHVIITRSLHIPVSEIGIMFYLIYPIFYTNISFSRLLTKRSDRIKCLIGGIFTNFFFAGISFFFCGSNLSSKGFSILFCNIVLNILIIATNLVIFFKLDGYYILQDILEISYLYENSMKYISEKISTPFLKFFTRRKKEGILEISSMRKGVKYIIQDQDREEKNEELYLIFGLLCMIYVPIMILSFLLLFFNG